MNIKLYRLLAVFLLFVIAIPAEKIESTAAAAATLENSIWGFDRSFGEDGFVYIQPDISGDCFFDYQDSWTFLLPDGRILVNLDYYYDCGYDGGSGVLFLRYDLDGNLEIAFEIEDGEIVGIQPDGKMIATGWDTSTDRYILLRYNGDFSLDPTFIFPDTAQLGQLFIGGIQPDGKILYADAQRNGAPNRLNSDGTLDETFPDNIGPFFTLDDITIHANGSFLIQESDTVPLHCSARVYSYNGDFIGSLYESDYGSPDNLCSLVRFASYPDGGYVWSHLGEGIYKSNPDTSWDMGFGDGGRAGIDLGPGTEVTTPNIPLASQPDGKIVFTGMVRNLSGTWPFIARYNADGVPDESLGGHGLFTVYKTLDEIRQILVQQDGKIILVGTSGDYFVLVRLHSYSVKDWVFLPLVNQ